MDIKQKDIIAHILGEISNDILLRKPPFETSYWPEGVSNKIYEKYHQVKDKLSENTKNIFDEYSRETTNNFFRRKFNIAQQSINLSSETEAALSEISELVKTPPQPMAFIDATDLNNTLNINDLLTENIKKHNPEFKLARKKPIVGVKTFYSNYLRDNKLFVGFDRSNLRSFMSFFFGFEKPWIMIDIGSFFLSSQSKFDYIKETRSVGIINGEERPIIKEIKPNTDDVVNLVNEAFQLMDQILPSIIEKLKLK